MAVRKGNAVLRVSLEKELIASLKILAIEQGRRVNEVVAQALEELLESQK